MGLWAVRGHLVLVMVDHGAVRVHLGLAIMGSGAVRTIFPPLELIKNRAFLARSGIFGKLH